MIEQPWHERTRTLIQLDGCDQREEVIEIGVIETDETIAYVPFAVEGYHSLDSRAEVRARLIAKAPELLDCLRHAVDYIDAIAKGEAWPDGMYRDAAELAEAITTLLAEIDGQ